MISQLLSPLFNRSKSTILPLDGLRAIAILMVVCFHAKDMFIDSVPGHTSLFNLPPYIGGWAGVPLFFALSGYLIGKQIWTEFQDRGEINFKAFFIKRTLRIWPLFYFLFFLFLLFPYKEHVTTYLPNFFFLSNYLGDNGPILASWSLSTEEQFYIFVPVFLNFAIFISKGRLTLEHFRWIFFALLFVPVLSRIITWYFYLGQTGFDVNLYNVHIYRPFHTHADGLIAGLLLSNWQVDKGLKPHPRATWIILGTMAMALLSFKAKISMNLLMVGLTASCAIWYCLISNNAVTRFLSHPILGLIARLSFSMYLIHWPCLYLLQKWGFMSWPLLPIAGQLLWSTLLVILMTIGLSIINFFLIERPCLKLRDRWLKSL